MISAPDRRQAVKLITEACDAGARKHKACEIMEIDLRTFQRWTRENEVRSDKRSATRRPEPHNKLSPEERQQVLDTCHQPEFASSPPSQIVPQLADRGEYLASESSFYRILREADEQHHRGRSRASRKVALPTSFCATGPNQVWSWDITWLPGPIHGLFFYLYMIIDIYSRKVVGWEVYSQELSEYASIVLRRAILAENCIFQPLVLHADNGSPQKGSDLKATMEALGVHPSYSRPRVSDDNPYSEAIFRTCKYRPNYPNKGFVDIEKARLWVSDFVDWYNKEHHHSGIKFVTPNQRHAGEDIEILAKRKEVYESAKALNPQRWSGDTRNWEPIKEVWLNPEKVELSGSNHDEIFDVAS